MKFGILLHRIQRSKTLIYGFLDNILFISKSFVYHTGIRIIDFYVSLHVGEKTMEQLRKVTDEQLRMIFAASCIKAAAGHILTII